MIGSGAFETADAERSVSVAVATMRRLPVTHTARHRRAVGNRRQPGYAGFNITGDEESDYPGENSTAAERVGEDSVYRFGEDAAHDESGLFAVQNQDYERSIFVNADA